MAEGVKAPDPEVVHTPVLAPAEIDPFNVWTALEAHTLASAPAFTIGNDAIVSAIASDRTAQPSVDVNVSVTDPAETSAALGVYVVFSEVAEANVPVPLVDQTPVDPPAVIEPLMLAELPWQMV